LEKVNFRKLTANGEIKIEKANNLNIKERRKMLRHVMLNLYHDIKKMKKNEKNYKDAEVMQEMRLRAYKIISNLVWEKFEVRKCDPETQVKIQDIVDMCKDNLKKPIHCFEMYNKHFTANFTEKMLLKLSGIPGLGRVFHNILIMGIYERYDLLLTLSETIGEVIDSHQFLEDEFANWKDIEKEMTIQLNSFEQARNVLLKGNKNIVATVQTLNAGATILNYGLGLVKKLYNHGEIDDLEYKKLMAHLKGIEKKLGSVTYFIKINSMPVKKNKKGKDGQKYESLNNPGTLLNFLKSKNQKLK
jgi:hypothetical protein